MLQLANILCKILLIITPTTVLKMKKISTTLFLAFWFLLQAQGQNVGIGIATPLDKLHVNGTTRTTGINLVGNSAIETGFGILGKEESAGKIGYGLFTPNTLDIVGGGNAYLERKIRLWAEGGSTFEGHATFNGNIGVGNLSPSQRLEVNGKIKIADDGNTPTAGTIRYNNTLQDFEGFNGTTWQSFTKPINTEYWGAYNDIVEIKPTSSIDNGVAIAKCMFSDNYLAISHRADPISTIVTRFYKWELGNWVYKTQVNADIIHTAPSSSLVRGRMTDDWLLFGNESLNNVSIYKRNGELWQFHSTIAEPSLNGFGDYYDIDGSKLVITTIGNSPGNNGRIFVYNFNGTSWVFQQTITDPNPLSGNYFGTGVSVKNNYLASSYQLLGSTLNSTPIYVFNGTSFVGNSAIPQKSLDKIFYEGSSVRIKVTSFNFGTGIVSGGIYKIGTTGFWELIPNTTNMDAISNYGLDYIGNAGLSIYALKKLEAGSYTSLCSLNYNSIAGSENFSNALLNKNCIIIPSTTGYKIFKKH